MASSLVQVAISSLVLGGLTFASSHVNVQIQQRDNLLISSTLPGKWQFAGCYLDGTPTGRTLSGPSYVDATAMTQESCVSFCNLKGYHYAGVEYAEECYCGNSLAPNTPEPITDCQMACKGNPAEACGAGDRLDVFWSGNQAPAGPQTDPGPPGWTLLGCYTEGTTGRTLTTGMAVPGGPGSMTVAACTNACAQNGFVYAGVEYSLECYCGNTITNGGGPAANGLSECNMPCTGNGSEYCGTGNRLDLYQKGGAVVTSMVKPVSTASQAPTPTASTPAVTGWKYDGCYTEGTTGRALQYGQPDSQANTVESCIATCSKLGYTIAGLEYSVQCFCDNFVYNGAAKAADSDCNMPCSGNNNEMCGAGNRLSVYNTGTLTVYKPPAAVQTFGDWTYQGCYSDNVNGQRALYWKTILTSNNSAPTCLGLCAQYGYMSAGMEYGDECNCGDADFLAASGNTKQPDTDCNTPCSGDPTTLCGAGNRMSYYLWTGPPLYVWNQPTGVGAGQYQFFMPGVVVPLMTSLAVNNKVTFLEKYGTGAPNTTGAYELDLTLAPNFNLAWREMHVQTDIFCAGGLTLPDKGGRQLTIGGWAGASTYGVRLYWPDGSAGVNGTRDWQEDTNRLLLKTGRWYPSALQLSNGSILVLGGEVGSNAAANPTLEILPPPAGGYVKFLQWLADSDPNNLYPFTAVLPSGGIFVAYWNEARILDPVTFDTITLLPTIPGSVHNWQAGRTYPLEGTMVILPQIAPYTDHMTIMICGGSGNGNDGQGIDNCVTIQPDAPNPQWTIERMPSQRVMTCIAALPDGSYLILNGAHLGVAGFGLATGPNLDAVLYNPAAPVGQRMSKMARTIVARLYHSEAILLPDGGVLVSGSDPEDGVNPEEYRVEKFFPPYLLSGAAKPSFTITNTDWAYGQSVSVQVTIPSGNIAGVRFSLMGAVSSTHGNSMGQRTIFPAVTCAGNTCTIVSPPANQTPPHWFQLFLLDGPTPSMSQWVRIGGDPAGLGNWPQIPGFNLPGV